MTIEPPKLTISNAALDAFRAASAEAGDADVLRLTIDARFYNDLFFGPTEPDDVVVAVDDLTIAMDASTARRADGLKIDFAEDANGGGFKLDNPNQSPPFKGVRPADVRAMLERRERFVLVDARDASERAVATLEAARLLDPAFEAELLALPRDEKLVFLGHHTTRGRSAARSFFERGFTNVWYVVGGIDAWSTMDPSVPRY